MLLAENLSRFAKTCVLSAAVLALPAMALADDEEDRGGRHRGGYDRGERYRHYDRRDDDRRDHDRDRGRPSIGISIGTRTVGGGGGIVDCEPPRVVEERVYVEPVYRTVTERKWVEPVYRTVTERVWVEPVVRTIPDRKWVPDRYEWREVVYTDHYGRRRCKQERVLVERGHFVDCPRTVEIAHGRWDTCTRQELVCEGRWETCERQELVSAGYWTTRQVVVQPPPRRAPYESSHARLDVRIPIGR